MAYTSLKAVEEIETSTMIFNRRRKLACRGEIVPSCDVVSNILEEVPDDITIEILKMFQTWLLIILQDMVVLMFQLPK